MIKQISILILTMAGIGNSKFAPGTVASLITCLIYIICFNFKVNFFFITLLLIIIFIYSVYSIDTFRQSFKEIDAKEIVIDEFIGQSIPVLTIYNLVDKNNISDFILYTFVSFVLFRIFDISKPYPIGKIDKEMKNGFGVILDDLVAGVYSLAVLLIIILFINYV